MLSSKRHKIFKGKTMKTKLLILALLFLTSCSTFDVPLVPWF